MNIRGIFFDYGGTIDTNGIHWSEVIWQSYQKEGVAVSLQDFRDAYVYAERELAKSNIISPTDNFLSVLRSKVNLQLQKLISDNILMENEITSRSYCEHISLYCYNVVLENLLKSKPLLQNLKSRFPLVLVSNFYGNLDAVLEDFSLNLFSDVVESAKVGVRKPDSAIFEIALKRNNLSPKDVIVVGDSIKNDILPAKSLGCHTVWLKGQGWENGSNDDDIPDHIITDISQLITIIDTNS